jgi:hypothetical protein
VRVDDGAWEVAPGPSVTAQIDGDGIHRLSYFARDLAGNRNDGSVESASGFRFAEPATVTVRIDRTTPDGAFKRPDRSDPALQRVAVSDATSGIAGVAIQLRREGADWIDLETTRRGGEYVTRVEDSRFDAGIYELRAVTTDVAGNSTAIDRFGDGAPARLELPLREATAATIEAGRRQPAGAGNRHQKIDYGARPVYHGVLRDSGGSPIAGARVLVRERFDAGSAVKHRHFPAQTNSRGRLRVVGSRGPSRVARVVFAGDQRYQPTSSAFARTLVRGRVRLDSYPRTVRSGKRAVFRGRIGTRGMQVPKRGKIYEVQLLVPGGGWKTLDEAQKSWSNGSFRFVYRFLPVERPVTFRVRVRVKRDQWAYSDSRSRQVPVTVKP